MPVTQKVRRIAVAAALSGGVTLGALGGVASAAPDTGGQSPEPHRPRLEFVCEHLDEIVARAEAFKDRLAQAKERLNQAREKAVAAGRDDLVARIDAMLSRVDTMSQRVTTFLETRVPQIRQRCENRPV